MGDFSIPAGINFSSVDNVSAEVLAHALCQTASFLQALDPYTSLLRYDDWWEHDGLHFYREEIAFDGLFKMIRSPQALLEVMPGDDEVFVGVAPMQRAWYLRFYLFWNDDGYKLLGRFDLTLPASLRQKYKEEVAHRFSFSMNESESAVYYESLIG
ncbi:MAG: hypothetical protein WAL47_09385 [Pyrinomonadaceae bacterium]